MPYSTATDVQGEIPTAYDETTPLVVNGVIAEVDSLIDGYLRGAGYVTPITGTIPDAVKYCSLLLACEKVLRIVYGTESNQVDENYIAYLKGQANNILNGIGERKLRFKIAMLDMSPDSAGDSLKSPTKSQFKLDPSVPIPNP